MNAVKLSLLNFRKNIFSIILVILETATLFLSVNYLASTLKERRMLIAPFEFLFNDKTAFVNDDNFLSNTILFNETALQSREHILENIKGDYKIYDVKSAKSTDGNYTIISLSDEIYSRLALPLQSGSYKNSVGTAGTRRGEHEITLPSGDVLKITTSGVLTATTFIPEMNSVSSAMSVSGFYSNSVNEPNIIITNRSSISDLESQFQGRACFFIEFSENAAENIAALRNVTTTMPISDIAENSQAELNDDLSGFVPLTCVIGFIVLLGIVFISVIIFKDNERKNAVFLLCGYSKRGIVGLHCAGIFMITVLSAGISWAAFEVLKILEIEAAVGVKLTFENLVVSILTILTLIIAAAIAPMILTARKSPADYLRDTN